MKVWTCGNGHVFLFGNEEWHYETNQGILDDGSPIPMFCAADFNSVDNPDEPHLWDEPCLDSSSLVWNDFEYRDTHQSIFDGSTAMLVGTAVGDSGLEVTLMNEDGYTWTDTEEHWLPIVED